MDWQLPKPPKTARTKSFRCALFFAMITITVKGSRHSVPSVQGHALLK